MTKREIIIMICFAAGTLCLVVIAVAGDVKKDSYNLYWQNKIALAHSGAVINDSLVSGFLLAPESFQTDSLTGELVTGAQRRTYSPDHQTGWILQVMEKADVVRDGGKLKKIYGIETWLVFDLRQIEKK